MSLLVRTWNVFHGNANPTERRAFLRDAVRLAVRDDPDVVCLQEVPAWALDELGTWSGMRAFGAVASRPALGPLPSTPGIGRLVTSLHNGLFRSAFSGQGNAVLVRPDWGPHDHRVETLNSRRFRRAQIRWLRLGMVAQLAWAKERRICQTIRLRLPGGGGALVANLHATSFRPDKRLADAELLRAASFADALARPEDVLVLAGDFNVSATRSKTLADLTSADWGFHGPTPTGIDHVLVRGAISQPPERWPLERRRFAGRVLSDHAPVDVRLG